MTRTTSRCGAALALASWLVTSPALAVDIGSEDSLASVEVHAFASQGGA